MFSNKSPERRMQIKLYLRAFTVSCSLWTFRRQGRRRCRRPQVMAGYRQLNERKTQTELVIAIKKYMSQFVSSFRMSARFPPDTPTYQKVKWKVTFVHLLGSSLFLTLNFNIYLLHHSSWHFLSCVYRPLYSTGFILMYIFPSLFHTVYFKLYLPLFLPQGIF